MSDDERDPQPAGELTPIGALLPGLFSHMTGGAWLSPEDAPPKEQSAPKRGAGEKSPRQATAALTQAAAEIAARPDKVEAAYLARELVQCTLPHRDPGDVTVWVRRNGRFALGLQPGADLKTGKTLGLPYGPLPRLLLLWIVSEAVRTKSRRLKLGDTLNDFLREIGLDPKTGRGPRGDATRLKEQMKRLFNCRISFEYSEGDASKGREARLNMEVVNAVQYWWDFTNPEQGALFESELVLGEVFFEAITARPVPLDMRALKPLKKSPLAIDLYTWSTYRIFQMQQRGQKEIKIPLSFLQNQFGAEYNRLDNFKTAFIEALAKVRQVYPTLDYTIEKNALILRDSKTRAMPTRAERRALPQARAQHMAKQINPRTRAWFIENYPTWDIETAISDFNHWREAHHIESRDNDAHFKSFVEKWAR